MIEYLNNFGQWLIEHLWQMSIELVLLGTIVALIIFLFRIKSPTLRHLFYGLILAKPVITFLIASPISLYWFLHPAPEPEPELQAAPAITYVQRITTPPRFSSYRRPLQIRSVSIQKAAPVSVWKSIDNYGICAIVWLSMAFALAVRFVIGFIYICVIRNRANIQKQGALHEILQQVSKDIKTIPSARLGLVEGDCGPVLAGIISPLILMPKNLSEHLSKRQLKLIIAHELIHVRRMDNLVLVIQRLAEIFLFFHPVVWICGKMMRNEAEAACDNAVLNIYGNSTDYADSLMRVAEIRENLPRRMLVNTFAAAESNFSQRIKRIIQNKPGKMTLGITILSVIALITIAIFGLPASTERKNEKINNKRSKYNMENKVEKQDGKIWIEDIPSEKIDFGWTSMLQAMKIVLEYYGEKPSMDELMVYSGDAFNLCHASNWELRIPLSVPTDTMTNLAKAYGLKPEWTEPHFFWKINKLSKNEKQKVSDAYLQKLYDEIDKGRPVLFGGANGNCGDWRVLAGYDKNNKKICLAGNKNTLEWTDLIDPKVQKIGFWDMQVRGTIKPGFYGGWMANATFIPGKKGKAPSEKQRALTVMKQAVEIFNAHSFSTKAYGDVTYYFGGSAYTKLAEDLRKLDYPSDLKKERAKGGPFGFYDVNNIIIQINQIVNGRTAAAKFCEKTAKLLLESEKSLLIAAKNYQKEAELAKKEFSVFLKSSGKENKLWRDAKLTPEAKRWLSKEANREKAAKAIVKMLKYDQTAINEISKVLKKQGIKSETITSSLTYMTDTKKIIDKVPVISWKKSGNCTYAAAMSAALTATEHPYSYTDIMGYSALAFRVRWRGEKNKKKQAWWCGSIPVGELPEEGNLVSEMTGWQVDCPGMLEAEKIKQQIPKIIKSIDKGMPVIGYPTMKNLNCAVLYGYEIKDGKTVFFWRDMFKGDQRLDIPADELGSLFMFLKAWKQPLPPKEGFIKSIKQAVRNWEREAVGNEKYYTWNYGQKAMELWVKDLQNADKFTKKQQGELFFVNTWNYQSLWDARKHAVKYLKTNSKLFSDKARKHLNKAAEFYKKEVEVLASVPGAFSGKKIEEWTPEHRKQEANIMSQALKLEQQAIDEIKKAFEVEGIKLTKTADIPESMSLKNVLGGKANRNWFGSGLSILQKSAGISSDYDTIMGDLGLAFIMQASDEVPVIDGALDVGWWPLAWDCLPELLKSYSQSAGIKINWLGDSYEKYKANPKKYYQKKLQNGVQQSIASGQPVLINHAFWKVVTAYDNKNEPPLSGFCPGGEDTKAVKFSKYPIFAVTLSDKISPISREKADIEALKRAIALGRDLIPMPYNYLTGQKAFALWIKTLRDTKNLGQARYHANVVYNLKINRRSAIIFLKNMVKRSLKETAAHLNEAIDIYKKVLAKLKTANTSKEALIDSKAGRAKLAKLAEQIARLEKQAVNELEKALNVE